MATSNFTAFNNDWTYCAQEGYISAGTFKNTNSSKIHISSVSLWLGTLSGYVNAGDTTTGNGKPISTTVKIGNTISTAVNVTAVTGTGYDSSVGYYPTHKNNPEYKFPISVTVNPGATVTIYVHAPNGINTSTGNCLTKTQNKGTVTYEVVPDYYTVSYDANGGTGAPASQQKIHDVNLTLSSTEPKKASTSVSSYRVTFNANGGSCDVAYRDSTKTTTYTFICWAANKDGSGTTWFPGGTYRQNASITLYASYVGVETQDSVGLPHASRPGYVFKGWAESPSEASGGTLWYTPQQNITLYATWERASITITYNANGGSGAPSNQSGVLPITISSTIPTRSNCKFKCWNTRSDESGTSYNPGDTYNGFSNVTLYAIWLYKFTIGGTDGTVTYSGSSLSLTYSADNSTLTAYLDKGTRIPLSEFRFNWDSYSGKTLQSWNTNAAGSGTSYSLTQTVSLSYALTLHAIAAPLHMYTVSFYDGKSPVNSVISSIQKPYGSELVDSDYPTPPTWPGHKFSGWVGGYSIVMKDMTITAMWGSSPVWIFTTSGWVKYSPKEKK